MLHGWYHVKCCRFGASSVYTIQPCTRLQCHFSVSSVLMIPFITIMRVRARATVLVAVMAETFMLAFSWRLCKWDLWNLILIFFRAEGGWVFDLCWRALVLIDVCQDGCTADVFSKQRDGIYVMFARAEGWYILDVFQNRGMVYISRFQSRKMVCIWRFSTQYRIQTHERFNRLFIMT